MNPSFGIFDDEPAMRVRVHRLWPKTVDRIECGMRDMGVNEPVFYLSRPGSHGAHGQRRRWLFRTFTGHVCPNCWMRTLPFEHCRCYAMETK